MTNAQRSCPLAWISIASVLAVAAPVRAVTSCVFDTNDLIATLAEAEDNGESDTLLLVVGVYTAPPGGFVYHSSEGESLAIVGGYHPIGITCIKYGPTPNLTILDAPENGPALTMIDTSPSGMGNKTYELDELVFADGGSGWEFYNDGAAISHQLLVQETVHRNLTFRGFVATIRGSFRLWNNLVVLNGTAADPANGGGVIQLQGATSSAVITHNTFSKNRFALGGSGLTVVCDGGAADVDVTNNILRDNGTLVADLDVENECDLALSFNSYDMLVGSADTSCCNTNVSPVFVDAPAGDFRLRWDSLLRNIGDISPTGGLPLTDFHGYPRLDGLLPDLGASEFPWVFADGFETGNASKWSSTEP